MSCPRPMSRRALPALLLAALAAAGCGGDPEAPTGPTYDAASLDACQLFPPAEVLAYTGGEGVSPMSSTLEDVAVQRNPLVCSYNAGRSGSPRIYSLDVRPTASPRAADRLLDGNRNVLRRLSSGEVQEVPGLGQEAIWAGGQLQQLQVRQGNLVLIATAQTENAARSLYVAKLIAERALARLDPPAAGGEDAPQAPGAP